MRAAPAGSPPCRRRKVRLLLGYNPETVVDFFGPDHVLFGSETPFDSTGGATFVPALSPRWRMRYQSLQPDGATVRAGLNPAGFGHCADGRPGLSRLILGQVTPTLYLG